MTLFSDKQSIQIKFVNNPFIDELSGKYSQWFPQEQKAVLKTFVSTIKVIANGDLLGTKPLQFEFFTENHHSVSFESTLEDLSAQLLIQMDQKGDLFRDIWDAYKSLATNQIV